MHMYIEDCIFQWRKEGKTWEETNVLRKQMPFCQYPVKSHQLARDFMESESYPNFEAFMKTYQNK